MAKLITDTLTVNTDATSTQLNYEVYLKPTPEKEYYRFRLLWFADESDRKTPFVERFAHIVWTENGDKRTVNSIPCPTSAHIRKKWAGNPFDDCPLCRFAGNNYIALKESNYKDEAARVNNKQFKRRFQAIIPVYVISDPVYDANNGKFKVFVIEDQAIYDKFKKLVIDRNATTPVFNGTAALDFLVRVDNVTKLFAPGTPEESAYTKKEIAQMGFSSKPYDIPAITSEAIDEFPFAGLYYASPTLAELKAFYKEFCLHAIDDDVDLDSLSSVSTLATTPAKTSKVKAEEPADELMIETLEPSPAVEDNFDSTPAKPAKAKVEDDPRSSDPEDASFDSPIDIDDLLNDVGV